MNLNQDKIITLNVIGSSLDDHYIKGSSWGPNEGCLKETSGDQDIFVSNIARIAPIRGEKKLQGKTVVILKESLDNKPVRLWVEENKAQIISKIKDAELIF